jgi:predicted nucleotidyltransferase
MEIGKLLEMRRDHILRAADKHGARNVRVFGSVARGEVGPASDVDFLVKMDQGRGLLDLSALVVDLRDLLGRKVDVILRRSWNVSFK